MRDSPEDGFDYSGGYFSARREPGMPLSEEVAAAVQWAEGCEAGECGCECHTALRVLKEFAQERFTPCVCPFEVTDSRRRICQGAYVYKQDLEAPFCSVCGRRLARPEEVPHE